MICLVGDDGRHHDEVEDGTNNAAENLEDKGCFEGQMCELGKLDVASQEQALLDTVVAYLAYQSLRVLRDSAFDDSQ